MKLTIQGLGPISRRASIPLAAPCELSGPSQAGKSTASIAIVAALTGYGPDGGSLPAALISDGAESAQVVLDLGDGVEIALKLDAGGIAQRLTTPAGTVRRTSAAQWADALGLPLGVVRHLCQPEALIDLRHAGDRGRSLRQAILDCLPDPDLRPHVAEVFAASGYTLTDADPLVEADAGRGKTRTPGAASLARDARRAAAVAEGAHAAACAALARLRDAPPPAPPDVAERAEKARAWLVEASAWETSAREHLRYQGDQANYQSQLRAWEAHRDELGTCPVGVGDGEIDRLRRAHSAALEQLHSVPSGLPDLRARVARLVAEAVRIAELRDSGTCPTCGQACGEIEHADADRLASLRAELRSAEEAEARRQADLRAKADAAAAALAECEARAAQVADYVRRRDLGPQRPTDAPTQPAPMPPRPAGLGAGRDRPAPDIEAALGLLPDLRHRAQESIAAADRAAGAAEGGAEALAAAEAAEATARQTLAAATADLSRLEALLLAVRAAPSRAGAVASADLEAELAQHGIALRWGGPGAAVELEIEIDGRPWWLASRGRQVRADLDLRLALRRQAAARYQGGAIDVGGLPVVVDHAQDWSGDWRRDRGVIMLRTSDAAKLKISRLSAS